MLEHRRRRRLIEDLPCIPERVIKEWRRSFLPLPVLIVIDWATNLVFELGLYSENYIMAGVRKRSDTNTTPSRSINSWVLSQLVWAQFTSVWAKNVWGLENHIYTEFCWRGMMGFGFSLSNATNYLGKSCMWNPEREPMQMSVYLK